MTKDDDVDEMVRRRMLEEQKIMESTRRNRKLRMRKLIGDEAEGVGDRKDHIDDAKKLWSTKGTTEQEKQNQLENYGTKTIGVSALQKAKLQYQQNLDAFKEKGKSAHSFSRNHISSDSSSNRFISEWLYASVCNALDEPMLPFIEWSLPMVGRHEMENFWKF